MKTALITPALHLEDMDLGNYHLVLTSQINKSEIYSDFYCERSLRGDHIILDNDAHEQRVSSSIEALLKAILAIAPDEVVLPDRLFFGEDTVEMSSLAQAHLSSELGDSCPKFMGVPQGRTLSEWINCLEELLDLVDVIGISKDYEVWDGGLMLLASLVRSYSPEIPIHLLGWGRDHLQLRELTSERYNIRGVDSAKPWVYSIHHQHFKARSKYPGRPDNFFSNKWPLNPTILDHNIKAFKELAGDHAKVQGMPSL